mgnify:CR=1 FL=1
MKIKLLIFLILCCLIKPQSALTAENLLAVANGYRDDVIYLQLGTNDLRNPVVHEEVDELQEIEDELPENNTEVGTPQPVTTTVQEPKKKETIFELENNIEAEYTFFENFKILDKNKDGKIDESSLIGRIMKKNIVRTDVPSYLLKEELTFYPQKGAISKVQFYGAYQGDLSSSWQKGDYDFGYDYNYGQIGAVGKFRNTKTDFKVVLNPKPNNNFNYMQHFVAEAYLVNNNIPHHKVVVGFSRNQVGKEGGSSSYILPFVTRSQIARNFGSTRALGVRLIGNYSLLDYNLALNSSDRFFRDWFPGTEFTGWLDFKPLGKTDGKYGRLIIGGGLNAGKNVTNYTVGSLYVAYKYKKLWTNFEYGIADGYNGSAVSTNKAMGFNGTIGYKIVPQLQFIARYDFFDPNRDTDHNNRQEYTAGINYFIKGQALRLILNYVFCQNQATQDSHRVIFATQLLL